MMKNSFYYNKKILDYCPNFNKIIDCDFYEGDNITNRLIKIYEEFVFNVDLNDKTQIEQLKKIDKLLKKYMDDYHFRGEIKKEIIHIKVSSDVKNVINYVVNKLIELFNKYTEGYTRNIYIPRWI